MIEAKFRLVILISGRGSNLQAIINANRKGQFDVDIVAVISNRLDAAGLKIAQSAGIATQIIDHTQFPTRDDFDQALMQAIETLQPDLIVLAGFMRILGEEFVNHFDGKLINIHPSLLPKYQGLNTHQRVLDNHESIHGASIHYVNNELDGGPVVLQVKVDVLPNDTADTLADRVLEQEHALYCQVIQWAAEKRLHLQQENIFFDGKKLTQPLLMKAR
jgi:phosphoribosylglycinamide formyltransferase-1